MAVGHWNKFLRMNRFAEKLAAHGLGLRRAALQTLQVNVGRQCNQACRHCHVDAGPWRTEMMDEAVARRVGAWIQQHRPAIVDITGGAPELNQWFRYLVETARAAGSQVLDRCNLTIIEEPGFDWLPEYLAGHQVEIVASLPCYSAENVTRQRGAGVFDKSIRALRRLNAVGYGAHRPLHLVYNPVGATLPGPQAELEADYHTALERDWGIVFNRLFTITNMPISRFLDFLIASGNDTAYLQRLSGAFNPAAAAGVMCRDMVSVGWDGTLYDCDFNQMLDLAVGGGAPGHVRDFDATALTRRAIETGNHCYGCTAGAGSSCGGSVVA